MLQGTAMSIEDLRRHIDALDTKIDKLACQLANAQRNRAVATNELRTKLGVADDLNEA